jgi:hypothetical protein
MNFTQNNRHLVVLLFKDTTSFHRIFDISILCFVFSDHDVLLV